jgi:pyruvate dehydrogenase E2 component (dihydrolipoamide acetyltransferase)
MAAERNLDLSMVKGTGPRGRITKEDVEGFQPPAVSLPASSSTSPDRAASLASVKPGEERLIPVTAMRRIIAQRMHTSLQNSAQLTMDMEIGMDDAVGVREQLVQEWQAEGIRPTYTDLVVRAVAKALVKHPLMNSQFRETEIALMSEINIGIAVALPQGLVVPVIRNADGLSLKALAVESARLAGAAKAGKLGLDDYAGGTFTVSALGMYGVDSFTPILNQPQAGILGVNRIYEGVTWQEDQAVKAQRMNLSLTWDHRVIDGAPAAEYLADVRELLEEPYRLLV